VSRNCFRLLVRATEEDGTAQTLVLGGVKWRLGDWRSVPAEGEALDFTCVSYSWGHAFVPHALRPDSLMSARTLGVAETVIASFAPAALWIDAYCVPASGPARQDCIRRLGAIYASASRVVAVLSAPWAPALERLAQGDHNLSEVDLLDADDWVARVWTYQEIFNSRDMQFIAEGTRVSLSAMELLNGVGNFMTERERALGIDAFALKVLHPRLDALQDLLTEWQIGSYLERPVFQLLSGMGTRDSTHADDRYHAMLGMIEELPGDRALDETRIPALEALLRASEAKGDFSFVYAVAPRSKVAGQRWRPAPEGTLRAPIIWHCFGSGQGGTLTPTHLRLNDIAMRRQGPLSEGAKTFICEWLGIATDSFAARDAGEQAYRRLRDAAFDGAAQAIECEGGLLFAQSSHADAADLEIVTPRDLAWVHGAPALLLERGPDGVALFRDVGVFIGPRAAGGESIDVA